MDDLSGLDWTSAPQGSNPPLKPASNYANLRPSATPPLSGRSTPLSPKVSLDPFSSLNGAKKPTKSPSPANDSFSNLLAPTWSKTATNLTLQERQKQLIEEKARQEAEQKKKYESQFGAQHTSFWDDLERGKETPGRTLSPLPRSSNNGNLPQSRNGDTSPQFSGDDEDILATFNSATLVDSSSHFPPPSLPASGRNTPGGLQAASSHSKSSQVVSESTSNGKLGDDDDPFGLGQMPQKAAFAAPQASIDDDDVLGALGKPVVKAPTQRVQVEEALSMTMDGEETTTTRRADPRDRAVAELVDMGFPADKARQALTQTSTGVDVQAAVGWLLNQAHEQSKQKGGGGKGADRLRSPVETDRHEQRNGSQRRTREDRPAADAVPPWMRQGSRTSSGERRQDSRSPAGEKDVSQYASEIGSTLFKSANSLWRTGQKKMQKAVAELQQEGGSSQPKWMRDASADSARSASKKPTEQAAELDRSRRTELQQSNMTDEALMLESEGAPPQKFSRQAQTGPLPMYTNSPSRGRSPAQGFPDRPFSQQPRILQQQQQQQQQPLDRRPAAKLSRQEVEDQSSQAYVSPARRKKQAPISTAPDFEPDILGSSQTPPSYRISSTDSSSLSANSPFVTAPSAHSSKPTTPLPTRPISPPRPKAPSRQVPSVSPTALSASSASRQKGSEAFKRGDYATAHTHYTAALSALPSTHPIAIIVLCNRALTSMKNGDSKAAVTDADAAIALIGVSRGDGETIALGNGEAAKDMKDLFAKALMRKAEALEHLEKWDAAAAVWKEAVSAGVGGSVAIQGRDRTEKAAGSGGDGVDAQRSVPTPAPRRPPPATTKKAPPPKPTAHALATSAEAEAVTKLRAANAAAERADDEKFALTDAVDAQLAAWKGTKSDNLRALLGSLDGVLWPEAGWKKVGMADLVLPERVKVVYMKAIAKVHPDKIPQSAATRQHMISAAVFSTLNEAWDKFKKDNGL